MTLKARVAATTLRAMGWTFVTPPPAVDRCVALALPHTSNMDGLLLVLMANKIGLEMTWMVKDSVNKPVLGSIVRGVGGVFIERSRAHGVVDQMIEQFAQRDSFCLIIPPEGSRSHRDQWKSGFYHIALGAKVPVVPGFLDYGRKEGGFGDPIEMTGDVHADMDAIRAFYEGRGCAPRYPEKFGPMRLREEDVPSG